MITLTSLPDSLGDLTNLVNLYIYNNTGLTSLPASIGNLSNLTSLEVSFNFDLVSLPSSLCQIPDIYDILEADDNGSNANETSLVCASSS